MKYLTNLDLSKNQLLNAVLQNLAAAPSSPVVGQAYYNTTDNKAYVYTNAGWVNITPVVPAAYTHPNHTGEVTSTGDGATVITANVVTNAKLADMATSTIKGRVTAATGDPEDLTVAQVRTLLGVDSAITNNHTHSNKALLDSYTQTEANLADAVGKKHAQNSDTGTSSATFTVGTSGVKIKNNGGTELQIRNNADGAYADLRVNNLIVEGTTTTVNSETVNVADNILLLNSNVTGTPTENGGIEIERGTSTNATIYWDETTDRWMVGIVGSAVNVVIPADLAAYQPIDADLTALAAVQSTGALVRTGLGAITTMGISGVVGRVNVTNGNFDSSPIIDVILQDSLTSDADGIKLIGDSDAPGNSKYYGTNGAGAKGFYDLPVGTVRKYAASIGDAAATSIVVTHNLNTQDVQVSLREVAAPYAQVMADVEITSVNTITVKFAVAPTAGQYRVIVMG